MSDDLGGISAREVLGKIYERIGSSDELVQQQIASLREVVEKNASNIMMLSISVWGDKKDENRRGLVARMRDVETSVEERKVELKRRWGWLETIVLAVVCSLSSSGLTWIVARSISTVTVAHISTADSK